MSEFKVQVIADSSGRLCGNQLVFPTRGEAEAFAQDLTLRWTLVRQWRVVETGKSGDDGSSGDVSPSSSSDNRFMVTLGTLTRAYRTLCTTAPSDYDAGTSIALMTGTVGAIEALLDPGLLLSNDKELPARVVLIEANMFEWHCARYASGLYASAEPDATILGSSEIATELLLRWRRGTPTDL